MAWVANELMPRGLKKESSISGYRFFKEEAELQSNPQAPPPPPICEKRVWKEIWQMQVPPKIKIFLWRACRNALPTKQALMRRKIIEDPMCEICKQTVEEPIHALWSCPKLDEVWSNQGIWGFRCEVGFTSVKELPLWMVEEGKSLELLAFTAWSVWNQRNKARLNLQAISLHQVTAQSRVKLEQYRADLHVSEVQVGRNSSGGNSWGAPPVGFMKVNFDGAISGVSRLSGVGVVIRDSGGVVLVSYAEKNDQAYKAEDIEAWLH